MMDNEEKKPFLIGNDSFNFCSNYREKDFIMNQAGNAAEIFIADNIFQ